MLRHTALSLIHHPASSLFPTITGAHWAAMFRRERSNKNELREQLRAKLSARALLRLRKDGL